MTGAAPAARGHAIFWGGVLAFALADLAPQLGAWLPVERAAVALSYALLAGFALSLAVVAGVILTALRTRRAPPLPDAARAAVAFVLAAGHAVLLAVAHGRKA